MARHLGGDTVEPGLYWNRQEWEIVTISRARGVLPGAPEVRYSRLPMVLMLALAPIMGGLFVMFLPLIGFAIVIAHLARRAGRLGRHALTRLLAMVTRSFPHRA